MKRQNDLKSMLCLLLGLVCHVAWAQTATPKVSEAPADGQWAQNTTWYQIENQNDYVLRADVLTSEGYLALTNKNETNGDAGLWCIVGDATDGYKFYNKAKGPEVVIGMKGSEANALAVFVADNEADYTTTFDVASSTDEGYWCVKQHGSTNNYWNQRNSRLAYWANNSGGTGDNGSTFLFTEVDLSSITGYAGDEAIETAQSLIKVAPGYPKTSTTQYHMLNVMVNSVGKGVISSELDAAVTAYKTCSDVILPENGKAYTMTSVMGEAADATKYYMKYVNGQKVSVSKTESDASVFVCKELRTGVYAFITSDGHILTWVGNNEGGAYKENNNIYGYSSNYATEYDGKSDWNEITVKKNGTAEKDFGYLRLVGRRNTGTTSSFIANANNRFDQAGDGYWFNATNSSAWIITEVEHTNTEAQTLALAKIDTKVAVAGNAAKLGAGIGYAHYVVNGEEVYDVTAINAGIDAATTVDAVNAIKNSYAVNLPEFGKAYTMTLVANDANKTQYKMIANDATLTASTEGESSVFYCLQSGSNDYPYIFVSEDGYVLAYHALTADYAVNLNGFKVEGMVEKSSSYITSNQTDRLGTVCITTSKRNANNNQTGCVIFKYTANSTTAWDNSSAPYHNGTYTSAIIMTEVENYTCTDAQIAKADDILGRTALKTQVEELRDQLKHQPGYYCCTINGVKYYDADAIIAVINTASSAAAVAEITAAINAKTSVLPEFGKAYKMAFKTKAGVLHHIMADDATLALSATTDEADASVFYCMQSPSADYPYIFVSAEGGFLTFKALSDAYISRVTDFKVGGMAEMSSGNITSSVDDRLGTVYITTNKRPGSTEDTDGCFVFKNQNNSNTYDGADVPYHNDNFTSAIVMTEVEAESKTIYEVVVDGDANAIANAYVACDNGTVVRKAFNGGFFVTNGATITEAQLSAGFVGNTVKSATISMEGRVITLSDVVTYPTPVKTDLYNTSNGSLGIPPHRIPGITVDPETGRIITTAARLVCGTDPGYGQVDVVCRISDDHGENWTDTVTVARGTGITSPEENYFDTAFGDPAVVADRTSDEVLIIVVAGCTKYQTATREIPNMIGTIHSTDNGDSWEEPVDVTEDIYSLFDSGNVIQSAFVGGGKIFQSRIVKVGEYYRLYAAMCARDNGNRVIYSDDFGRTWHALGGASALPAPGGDEPKCEEMPDGRVILSSRVGGGRIYNIYTYTNTATAEGSWDTAVTSTFEGSGKVHNGQSTNGEILIVPVVRNSDQKDMYLTLQSLPAGSGRSHVGIFYKELTDMTDINTVANFAIDWNGYFEVTDKSSAYSSMDLQADDRIGFIYEENYTKHGVWPNPHSIPFPDADNLGEHNYDGYDNIYVAYPLEIITNGAYSIKREVDRREFLQTYFTDLTADAADEVKAAVATCLEGLSTEPTIGEVDNIYFNISKGTVITDLDANAGKIGGFTDAVIADYKAAVKAATTPAELAAAKATALASAEWNMPVSGKAYTFKNVQKDGTTVRWYKYDAAGGNIVLTADEAEATPFVCSLLENGKYVFVCSDGKYMTWRANASGHTTSGVLDAYDMTANKYYTDITIAKMTTGGNIANDLSTTCYVSISASRDDRNEIGYVVVKKNGGNPTFDGAGAAYWNDNYSSAFILEEAEVAFGNTPKMNDVEEGELLSEDLHNKHMSTFSATYATVVPEGVTAYYATREGENVALNAIAAGKAIPANTGVILVSEEGGNIVMLPAAGETVADVTGNLMGHSAGAAKDMADVANAYLLTKGTQGVGFYRCSGGTLAANKAYLQLESTQQALRIRVRSAGDETTSIDNGQLTMDNVVIYDLYGRKVSTMQKGGVYIVNGKKVIR